MDNIMQAIQTAQIAYALAITVLPYVVVGVPAIVTVWAVYVAYVHKTH